MKPTIYPSDQIPFACLDTDGFLNVQGKRCHWWHIDDPKRIRRAKWQQWQNKHPLLCILPLLASTAAMIWFVYGVIVPLQSKPEPEPTMSQRGLTIQKQFSELSSDDQSLIVQKWQQEQPTEDQDPPDYP